jgi:hypothetical protein
MGEELEEKIEGHIADSFKQADIYSTTGAVTDSFLVYGKHRNKIDLHKLIKPCSGLGLRKKLTEIGTDLIVYYLGKVKIYKIVDIAEFTGKDYKGLKKHIQLLKNARDRKLDIKLKTK